MIQFRTARPLFALALLAAVAACGGAQPPSTVESPESAQPPTEGSPAPAEQVPGDEKKSEEPTAPAEAKRPKFDELKPGEKMAFMKNEVLPKMKKVFQDSGDDEFTDISCKTCHGSRASKGDFEMPNAELPVLDFADGLADEKKAHPKMTQYMIDVITPEMAKLLGEEHYDPATGKGFGCTGCHTAKK
ncbi:MAG TPA: hypothetical protein VLC09_05710 [Polyangiaceae bacterium]|nr:hypothetical protein [Polyangiaceae bacterium]